MKKIIAAVLAVVGVLALTACDDAVSKDKITTDQQMQQYGQAQAVPQFSWSQERATLIAILKARTTTTATTSFFFNQGATNPISTCNSIGLPIATTAQLTNPDQVVGSSGAVLGQAEPSGIYTGESTGTYVVCTDSQGRTYPVYWEGSVYTVGGPAKWSDGQVVLTGQPTVEVEKQ